MAPKKPTGRIGPINVSSSIEGGKLDWRIVSFPTDKSEIENKIMFYFCKCWSEQGFFVIWKQNKENDYDFTLTLGREKVYLDLMEIIHWSGQKKPHETAQAKITVGDYADQIIQQITRKIRHYPTNSEITIDLLTYITHWKFVPNEYVMYLVQKHFAKTHQQFENIFFLCPHDEYSAVLRVLYPLDAVERSNEEIKAMRYHWYLLLDPSKFELRRSEEGNNK